MSKSNFDTKLDLLEKFDRIKNTLKKDVDKIFTINDLVKEYKITQIEAFYILNSYVQNLKDIDNYIIFFLVEIYEEVKHEYKKKLIPSYSDELSYILKDQSTLSCNVFALCYKNENFTLKDYTSFTYENQLISRFAFEQVEPIRIKEEKNIQPTPPPTATSQPAPSQQNKIASKQSKPVESKPSKISKASKISNTSKSSTQPKLNSDFNKKVNIVDSQEEENYYGGFKPKKRSPEQTGPSKKKAGTVHYELSSGNDTQEIRSKKGGKDETIMEIDEEIGNNEPQRVKKIRKVKKTNTYTNEKGYLVTKDEYVDEEYWVEEKPQPAKKLGYQPAQPQKKGKKLPQGQSSLLSFFG